MFLKIERVSAREILDLYGSLTIKADVSACCGFGRIEDPSGVFAETHEVLELCSEGIDMYGGMGVLKAVKNVNEINVE